MKVNCSKCGAISRSVRLACKAQAVATQLKPAIEIPPQFNTVQSIADQTRGTRARLQQEHVAGGLVYLEAGDLVRRNGVDVYYRFRPDSNFAYVAGYVEPGAAALFDTESGHFTLLLPKQPVDEAFWLGPQPSRDQIAEEYGADSIAYTNDLKVILNERAKGRDIHVMDDTTATKLQKLVSSRSPSGTRKRKSNNNNGSDDVDPAGTHHDDHPRVTDALLPAVIHRARSIKTDAEVACLMQASKVSAKAHMDVWSTCQPGMAEYQLEAAFTASCMAAGLQFLGYPCIVGGGCNSAVLHYETNRCTVKDGEFVLIDAGAEYRHYTADITRTFPANGKFSPKQKDIYNAVLNCQELALNTLKQGVVFKSVDQAVRELLLQQLQDIGIVKSDVSMEALKAADIDKIFMPHGLGHFLGLDVHDPSDQGMVPKKPLQPGYVITVEPGLYFIDLLLNRAQSNKEQAHMLNWDVLDKFRGSGGVRIEDNIVVMSGNKHSEIFNLTTAAGLPKTVDDLEGMMTSCRPLAI